MKKYPVIKVLLPTAFLIAGIAVANGASPPFSNFITMHDGKLFDGNREFRFLSFNLPNLLEIEDNVAFTNENPWRLPDSFEIRDALETVRQLGGQVARTYVITVERSNDMPEIPRYVLAPGKFDEHSFQVLDQVLAEANRTGVRLIIPLVDNWPWMGGRADYARWRGKSSDAFWTDPQLISDFKQTIHFILTRTNTVTGIRYGDDKAILCWETGNEINSPVSWTRDIAHYIKTLDPHHLVMDGYNSSVLRDESLELTDIDIVTTHHYPGNPRPFSELIRENAARAKGKKAYIIGEFGFVSTLRMMEAMDAITASSASGGLVWSLRFRDRDGGFYWHSEPFGGNLYKAFHWPPSPLGNPYDETKLMNTVRDRAFAIRGLPVPTPPVPTPPNLLPIADAAAISWQGSCGATGYQIERAANPGGPWRMIATQVDEAFTQFRPEFADETVPAGKWYYRVRAINGSGFSGPSNIVGPVVATNDTLVDELADLSKTGSHAGDWRITDRDCRAAKEDAHRVAGIAGDWLRYQLPNAITGFRIFAFFPKAEHDPRFFLAGAGQPFQEVAAHRTSYYHGAGDYGYWRPVEFDAEPLAGGTTLKIELTGDTQIGRVEISHPAPAQ